MEDAWYYECSQSIGVKDIAQLKFDFSNVRVATTLVNILPSDNFWGCVLFLPLCTYTVSHFENWYHFLFSTVEVEIAEKL